MATSITADAGKPVEFGGLGHDAYAALQDAVDKFYAAIDWDTSVDSAQLLKQAAAAVKAGQLQANNQTAMTEWFWNHVPAKIQKAYPGAEYGLYPDAYESIRGKLATAWYDLIGVEPSHDVLRYAFQHRWTPEDVGTWVYDEALKAKAGDKNVPSWLDIKASPWLLSGVSYESAAQQYASMQPQGPINAHAVKGWWNFVSAARELGTSKPVSLGDQQQREFRQQSETR
jgi:hypothetical protein